MSTLDPHAPFVLDTRELGRRPGTSQRVRRMLPAPGGLAVGLAEVPADTELAVDLLLEAVMEGVLVTLRTTVPVHGECARCLDEVATTVDVQATELFAYADTDTDEETRHLDGELVDLEPVLRDAIVLELPATMLCRPDCPGLCPRCGARLADDPGHHHTEPVDPRWAALGALSTADPTPPPEEH